MIFDTTEHSKQQGNDGDKVEWCYQREQRWREKKTRTKVKPIALFGSAFSCIDHGC